MPDIQPYTASSSLQRLGAQGRQSRQETRAHLGNLARIERTADLQLASLQAVADVQQSKADVVARTGGYVLQQAALVSQMQQQLALATPASSGDLDYIKTLTVMQLGQVVTDTGRQVNRS